MKKIKVIVAKPGLDGHDRGAKVIARAGFEVIYTGIRQTPEDIAIIAQEEDADVIAMSLLSGAHNTLFPKVVELLKEKGLGDRLVVGGGVIPESDIPFLKEKGIKEIFTPGSKTEELINFIKENVKCDEE